MILTLDFRSLLALLGRFDGGLSDLQSVSLLLLLGPHGLVAADGILKVSLELSVLGKVAVLQDLSPYEILLHGVFRHAHGLVYEFH